MTGIKWLSTSTARKKRSASLAIFEVKYDDNAITGNAGIIKHFKDIESFINSGKINKLYSEAESQFNQKVELGLIKDITNKISVDVSLKPEFIRF